MQLLLFRLAADPAPKAPLVRHQQFNLRQACNNHQACRHLSLEPRPPELEPRPPELEAPPLRPAQLLDRAVDANPLVRKLSLQLSALAMSGTSPQSSPPC